MYELVQIHMYWLVSRRQCAIVIFAEMHHMLKLLAGGEGLGMSIVSLISACMLRMAYIPRASQRAVVSEQ